MYKRQARCYTIVYGLQSRMKSRVHRHRRQNWPRAAGGRCQRHLNVLYFGLTRYFFNTRHAQGTRETLFIAGRVHK